MILNFLAMANVLVTKASVITGKLYIANFEPLMTIFYLITDRRKISQIFK